MNHRKRPWLAAFFPTDVFRRAIGSTELGLSKCGLPGVLNCSRRGQVSALLAIFMLIGVALLLPLLIIPSVVLLIGLNWPVGRFLVPRRGIRILPRAALAVILHHLAVACGTLAGAIRYGRKRDPFAVPVLATLLLTGAGLQIYSGTYTADFVGYPDEPSHFVTSALFTDYLQHPFKNPVTFANHYYLQYPKVGLGHWPPAGYLLQGLWMHLFGVNRFGAMTFMLVSAVLAAFVLYELCRHDTGRVLATCAAVAWLSLGSTQVSYLRVMMDMPAVAASLLATLVFREYVVRPNARTSLLFGLLAACALTIKQQAVVLVVLPPLFLLISRRFDLVRRRDFWVAAIPPLAIAGPWHLFATRYFYQNFVAWSGIAGKGPAAAGHDWSVWWNACGLGIAAFSVCGFLYSVWRGSVSQQLTASILASAVASSAVLRVMSEPRHLLFGLAAQVVLAAYIPGLLPWRWKWVAGPVLVLLSWSWLTTPHRGYNAVAAILDSGPEGHVLLCSPQDGGIIAAALAERSGPEQRRYWLRAGKLLGEVRWSGRVMRLYVHTTGELLDLLSKSSINQVLVENQPDKPPPVYAELLQQALALDANNWFSEPLPVQGADARLYRRRDPIPPRSVQIYIPRLGHAVSDGDSR